MSGLSKRLSGKPEVSVYIANGENIYLWTGEPVAYLRDEKVYAFSGRFLGWYEGGWLRDRTNRPALFGPDAEGGPIEPVRHVAPVKG